MKIANSGGTPTYTRPCCTSELEIQDEESLKTDIENFTKALSTSDHSKAFMNAASPGVINVFMPNKFYQNDDIYLEKLSNIMSAEYKTITKNNNGSKKLSMASPYFRENNLKLKSIDFLSSIRAVLSITGNLVKNSILFYQNYNEPI